MKNKKIISLGFLLVLFMMVRACGQNTTKVTVVDHEGQPIEGVVVKFIYARVGNPKIKSTKTDEKGETQDVDEINYHLKLWVTKEGYYKTAYSKTNNGTHLEKNQNHDLTVSLKKVVNPIALFAKKTFLKHPKEGENVGYDFEVGDWVTPHGKGKKIDIIIYSSSDRKSSANYDYKFKVTFPNPLDGLLSFRSDWVSELRSLHCAPINGYRPKLDLHWWRKPDSNGGQGNQKNQKQNYWVRVRSKVDEEGNLISAHYVKIYGDFPDIQYYFNPTPNDRNLEFDPHKNLFKNLPYDQKVNQP